jgi:sec-independent protein translocase protein TatC
MFIKPALKDKEKKYFYSALFLIPLVFFLGTIFAYKILAPIAFGFFINFASSDNVSPVWSFSEYLDLLVMFMLISGAVFQTPLILVILMALKIITIGMLRHFRPWIIIFIFIFSALLTPPDVVSQLLLSALFYVFFEIAILAGKYV